MVDHAVQEDRSDNDAGSSPNRPARPDPRMYPLSPGTRWLMVIALLMFLVILLGFIFGVLMPY